MKEETHDILDIIGSLEAIQKQADAADQSAVYNWAENTFTDFTGLTLDGLKRLWDSPQGEVLKQYIKRYDDNTVQIKTKKDSTDTGQSGGQSKVAQMAKSATSRRQG
jgi:hypothetical protein